MNLDNYDKYFIGFLVAYAVISIGIFSYMDVNISNSYQRANSAAFVADFIKEHLLKVKSFDEILKIFIDGQLQYKIFTGLTNWPPLQVILLTISFLIFGINKFSFIFFPLIITLLTLFSLYKLIILAYRNKKTALFGIIVAGLSTFFFYESASPMLENGLALFTIASIYYLVLYFRTNKEKYFYFLTSALALGFIYKDQMIIIAPVIILMFFYKTNFKEFFADPKSYKMLLISFIIILVIFIPLIFRDVLLSKYGLSRLDDRFIEKFQYLKQTDSYNKGYLNPYDFEFENSISDYKRKLIIERYTFSYFQKSFIFLTSTFFNWILIPFIITGIFYNRKKFKDVEISIILFVMVYFVFFSLDGSIPRFVLPASILLIVFAVRGLFELPKKLLNVSAIIILALLLIQTSLFFSRIYNNEHVGSMQHDYNSAAEYVLEDSKNQGNVTIITSRVNEMAFYLIKLDKEKRISLELLPQKQENLDLILRGNFSVPDLLKDNQKINYPLYRAPVKYIIVHENLETGPSKGSADYDARKFIEKNAKNIYGEEFSVKIIDSKFPNSKTWIYKLN